MTTLRRLHGVGSVPIPHGAQPGTTRLAALLEGTLILRVGLAALFLVNALIAWVDPDQFTTLVESARVDRLVSSDVILWVIRVNDLLVGLALLFAWNRWPRLISAWVGLYVLNVAAIKLVALV